MSDHSREVKSFFYSQYFSDGLRICLGILLPSLVLMQFNMFSTGLTLSLGALCICVVDIPGSITYKRNAMLVCCLSIFIVSVLTGFARMNVITLGIEITVLSFIFSMFTVYGTRVAAIGTASLLVMVFMIDKALKPAEILPYSCTIVVGGIWYTLFSVVFFGIRPYRAAQQALGESVLDVVKFLRIKADFYEPGTDIDDNYRKLVSQQIQVSQHQDLVREILFKSRMLVRESTNASRILVLTFIDLVDLFEQIMATHYDYSEIRERFKDTDILPTVAQLLHRMANELDNIGYAILSNTAYPKMTDFMPELEELKQKIDNARTTHQTSNLVLKKILINIRNVNQKISNIFTYYNSRSSKQLIEDSGSLEHSRFVTRQDFAPHIFFDNLTFNSASFKHAARVSLVCLVGFVTAKLFSLGHHSYWVLLTIIVILKPGFSLSKQRNYQRLIGTVAGGIIGVVVLTFIPNTTVQFVLLSIFMLGTYSFQRLNYVVSVIFMTPYVLIFFKFLGVGHLSLFEERVLDTIIGSTIALAASYWLFPSWEFELINTNLRDVVFANANYLVKLAERITKNAVETTEYKLARKDVYVKSANLTAAFERMTSEPKSKQRKVKEVHKFVVLSHILSSYIATISAAISGKDMHKTHAGTLKSIKRSIAVLNDTAQKLGGQPVAISADKSNSVPVTNEAGPDEALLAEQLEFIHKISTDLSRVTDTIV